MYSKPTTPPPPTKPRLRGYLHQEAFFIALGASILLVAKSTHPKAWLASSIYSVCLMLLFAISAFYHRIQWQPTARALMKRLDHVAIYFLIAGTFTPICLLALPVQDGNQLLLIVWSVAIAGTLQSVFWVSAPKWFTALAYVLMGWLAAPYLSELREALGGSNLWLLASGGIAYSLGALIYALKRPNPIPGIFAYHELFHFFTIVGATLHFIVIYHLIA